MWSKTGCFGLPCPAFHWTSTLLPLKFEPAGYLVCTCHGFEILVEHEPGFRFCKKQNKTKQTFTTNNKTGEVSNSASCSGL